jgi:hypothetical protein
MTLSGEWRVITPGMVESLPDGPGVFALGSLVRSILVVGGDDELSLREAVERALANPRLRLRAHCIRIELAADPATRVREILAGYARAHGDRLPPEQPRAAASAATPVHRAIEAPRPNPLERPRTRVAPSWSERGPRRFPAVA